MDSILDYLITYGWMILVIAIVGGAVYLGVENSGEDVPEYVNTGERFLDDQMNGYTCSNASLNKEGEYVVDCDRSINHNNSTVYNTRSFQITEYNESAAIKAQ